MATASIISLKNPIVNIPRDLYLQLVEPYLDISELLELSVVSTEFHQLTSKSFHEKISCRIIRFFHITHDEDSNEYFNTIRINGYHSNQKFKFYVKKLIDFFIPQLFLYIQKEKIIGLYLESYSSGSLMEIVFEITNKEEKIQQIINGISANTTLTECNIGLFEIFRIPKMIGIITKIFQAHPTLVYFDLKSCCHTTIPGMQTWLYKRDDGSVVLR